MIDLADSPEPEAPSPPRPHRLVLVAGLSLMAGAGAAVAVLLFTGWRPTPIHQYEVTVVLKVETTVEQRNEISVALENIVPGDGVRLVTREETFEQLRTAWESRNRDLPDSVTPATMREQLKISTSGRSLDCGSLDVLQDDTRVDDLLVSRVNGDNGQKAWIVC
ncbi:permease-like cell division protein FtsX [Actinoplanes sp. NEAU-A12]|uniref:Permease-like cell division protein FtsX n=1 Tax=Actinoplanes sandaracinus TaxID=3045177 RepID=A0ABT6WYP2_9ACTN|nr:permease-like cell division protein FtsX [Actinoplanes sandaracinus]MDI6104858.1 permease-like cell division protein FtsX [Actinoplanes sandaracinus]